MRRALQTALGWKLGALEHVEGVWKVTDFVVGGYIARVVYERSFMQEL